MAFEVAILKQNTCKAILAAFVAEKPQIWTKTKITFGY